MILQTQAGASFTAPILFSIIHKKSFPGALLQPHIGGYFQANPNTGLFTAEHRLSRVDFSDLAVLLHFKDVLWLREDLIQCKIPYFQV